MIKHRWNENAEEIENSSKQLEVMEKDAKEVGRLSRIITASTENTYMPMIQLAFIFPILLTQNYHEVAEKFDRGKKHASKK